jgi:hypothetical protein
MKIDWKRKLTSRKFWAAVVGFVTSLLVGFGCADSTAAEVTSIIMAGATLIAYILGEGMVDSQSVGMNDTSDEYQSNQIGFITDEFEDSEEDKE